MAHDVFISYSRRDTIVAKDICRSLKKNNISFWIDTSEIEVGDNFAERIVPAIRDCKITIFISSHESNISRFTVKEIVLAFKHNKHIIPFRIEDISFSDQLDFFLCDLNWVDAFKNYKMKLEELITSVKQLLAVDGGKSKSNPLFSTPIEDFIPVLKPVVNDGARLDESGKVLLEVPRDTTEYTTPKGVTKIAKGAFKGCEALSSIDIADTVLRIEESAFEGCVSLKRVRVPNSVIEIGKGAFRGCINLNSVMLSNSISELPSAIFEGCSALQSVTLPNTISTIGERAFAECSSIMTILLPGIVREIKAESFRNCRSLGFLMIPQSVEKIGERAFAGCARLMSVSVPRSTNVDSTAFEGTPRG